MARSGFSSGPLVLTLLIPAHSQTALITRPSLDHGTRPPGVRPFPHLGAQSDQDSCWRFVAPARRTSAVVLCRRHLVWAGCGCGELCWFERIRSLALQESCDSVRSRISVLLWRSVLPGTCFSLLHGIPSPITRGGRRQDDQPAGAGNNLVVRARFGPVFKRSPPQGLQ
jgi:hypothetical protein